MSYYIGVDGGGSNLRVALIGEDLRVITQVRRGTVNPTSIGRDVAAWLIADALGEVIKGCSANEIEGVGIGIAGASADYAADWLVQVVHRVLPGMRVIPASDIEMALVGAHGQRYGALLLAGTGSVACGIGVTGRKVQVGGWGYQLGDEGGGYWLGLEAIKHALRVLDSRIAPGQSALASDVLNMLQLPTSQAIIAWMYGQEGTRIREIAQIAQLVLDAGTAGDIYAQGIISRAADELALLAKTALRHFPDEDLPLAFAGGVLETENVLSILVCSRLGLSTLPQLRYPPVVGAALLAKLTHEGHKTDAY